MSTTLRLAVCKKLKLSATATQADIYRAALRKIGLGRGDLLDDVTIGPDGVINYSGSQGVVDRIVQAGLGEWREVSRDNALYGGARERGGKFYRAYLTSAGRGSMGKVGAFRVETYGNVQRVLRGGDSLRLRQRPGGTWVLESPVETGLWAAEAPTPEELQRWASEQGITVTR